MRLALLLWLSVVLCVAAERRVIGGRAHAVSGTNWHLITATVVGEKSPLGGGVPVQLVDTAMRFGENRYGVVRNVPPELLVPNWTRNQKRSFRCTALWLGAARLPGSYWGKSGTLTVQIYDHGRVLP